jgi:hypothetical protein
MNGKPLASNIFCYLEAAVRMDKMMEGRPEKSLFLGIFGTRKIVDRLTGLQFFLDPPISQDQNMEHEEARLTTSELTVFTFIFQLVITVIAQPF